MDNNEQNNTTGVWPEARQFKKSIRTEFALYISAVILILMTTTGYIITDKYVGTVTQNVVEKLLAQSRAYSGTAGKLIIAANGPDELLLNNICNRMKNDDSDIFWAAVTDKDKTFLAHTDLKKVISGGMMPSIGRQGFENLLRNEENFHMTADTIMISVPVKENDITVGFLGLASSTRRIDRARMTSIITVASITAVMILIGLPLTILTLNKKLKPIAVISDSLKRVNPDNIAINIPVTGKNEFGYLSETLRVMGDRLNLAQRQLIEKERLERELEIARQIQENILPKKYPRADNYEFYGMYRSAREVGGDYYDFIDLDRERQAFLVADVSGKSLPGMLVMLMTRDIIRNQIRREHEPSRLLSRVNEELLNNIKRGTFVTMFFGVLDRNSGIFSFASAGHNHLLVVDSGLGTAKRIKTPGFPLGMVPPEQFGKRIETGRIILKPDDWLVQYTDGINEAQNVEHEEFGMEKFIRLLEDNRRETPRKLVDRILTEHRRFTGDLPQFDDITLLVMKWKSTITKEALIKA
jgi:sigma-B regulation protein RsbU (phosphoserine phosphatase)